MHAKGWFVLSLALVSAACGAASPAAATSTPPAVAASPAASPRANSAPSIAGEAVCIGAMGVDHVFELELRDPDGDALRWTAVKAEPQGTLQAAHGERIASGTVIRVVYSPPAGQRDENWIVVTTSDDHGASASLQLYARSR